MSDQERLRELDLEGLHAIRDACLLYHRNHGSGIGGAAMCSCGAGGGGSTACRGLSIIRDFFQAARIDVDPRHEAKLELLREVFGQ